ncbi:MAG: DUF1223 domain-containing protein [Burkholderiaceae bacterium]|nr:DUF1223 domain-containing protein [Burkholderiaceae bacterium]
MGWTIKQWLAAMMACVMPLTAYAQTCHKQSPAHMVALLELYTSEGCSSCPPADQAVGALQTLVEADLVVPLALHVDYWDDLGWRDPFDRPDFTDRQRWLTSLTGGHTVYTPEIFLGGRELRSWSNDLAAAIATIDGRPAQADILLTAGSIVDNKLPIAARLKVPIGSRLFLALYETGLSSKVAAGENGGRTLHHDYVVRDWLGPLATSLNGQEVSRMLTVPTAAIHRKLGVAAFVQDSRGDVLQAVALSYCGK